MSGYMLILPKCLLLLHYGFLFFLVHWNFKALGPTKSPFLIKLMIQHFHVLTNILSTFSRLTICAQWLEHF